MRGSLFLFLVLCIVTVFIGDCSRAEAHGHQERLVEICGKVPSIPSIKPANAGTFELLAVYRVNVTDWIGCGMQNAETKRDRKLINKVRFTSDEWTLLGLQEINRWRRKNLTRKP